MSELERPRWTVLIPTYNRLAYLSQCLQSVLEQAPEADQMEILVCDDHSSTDIAGLVSSLRSGRILFRRARKRLGQWRNVNDGLAQARGDWIHVLHDDDFVLPGFYQTMQEAVASAPASVGVICSPSLLLDQAHARRLPQPQLQPDSGLMANFLARVTVANPVNMPSVVVARKVYETVGTYCPSIPYCADWEFFIRSALHFDWWYVNQPLACYRLHADSVSGQGLRAGTNARDLCRTLEKAAGYLPEAVSLDQARRLHARNFCAEAAQAFHQGHSHVALALLRNALRLGARIEQK